MKEIIFHSSFFVLVDRKGQIRGYYDGRDQERLKQLKMDIPLVRKELYLPLNPTINATLNGLAGIFLIIGFLAIKRKDKKMHRMWMMAAFICSTLFLCSYVYFHATTHILTKFQGTGMWRLIFFGTILGQFDFVWGQAKKRVNFISSRFKNVKQ